MLQVDSLQETNFTSLLSASPQTGILQRDFIQERRKDARLRQLIDYMERGTLPDDDKDSRRIMLQALNFAITDKVLYFLVGKKLARKGNNE